MATKIYVGNLTYGVTDDRLEALFTPYGNVRSAQVVTDRETGRSKGFGFVEMEDREEANTAMKELHEQQHDGRPLTVNEARPREERSRGGYGSR